MCPVGWQFFQFPDRVSLRPWSAWTANSDKKYMELNGAAPIDIQSWTKVIGQPRKNSSTVGKKKKKNDSLKNNAVEQDRHTMRTTSAPSFTNKRNNNRSLLHRS